MWGLDENAIKHLIERRNEPGVHIYIDNPQIHSRRGVKYQLLNDTLNNTWNFKYTALLLATGDNPTFGLIVSNTAETRLIEVGIGSTFYFYVWFCDNLKGQSQTDTTKLHKLRSGYYLIVSWDLFTIYNRERQLQAYVNGQSVFENVDFHFEGDHFDKTFGNTLTHHSTNFDNIVIKEHHFVYGDYGKSITEILRKNVFPDYVNFDYCELCYFSAGGYAKIRGKYKNIYAKINGILIGFARAGFTRKLTFDYDPHTEVEFQVSAGEFLTYISSPDKFCGFEKWLPQAAFVWVLVQNINIKNIEIHTGRSIKA